MKPLETATMVIPEDRDAFQTAITNSVAMRPDGGQVLLITTPVTTPATLAANKTTAIKTEKDKPTAEWEAYIPHSAVFHFNKWFY